MFRDPRPASRSPGRRRWALNASRRVASKLRNGRLNTVCAGKKDLITAWGGTVETRTAATPTTAAPLKAEARSLKKTPGAVVAQCKAEPGAVCYLFQQGGDPAHPEPWPPPVIESGCTHKLTGQTVGAKLYFRVAIQRRKTGLGQWSDILEVTVK